MIENPVLRKRSVLLVAAVCAMIAMPEWAAAQGYGFTQTDTHVDNPVNVYFGSAKDASGEYLQGVTIVLETKQTDFVAVTDVRGRFRLELPVDVRPDDVKAKCSRQGYTTAQVVKRLPHGDLLTPVEVSCKLKS